MDNWQKVLAAFVVIFTCNGWYSYLRRIRNSNNNINHKNHHQRRPPIQMDDYFTVKDNATFPQFQQLGEDLMLHVLSFAAEAPLEDWRSKGVQSYVSPLTHSLPLVSQQFRRLLRDNAETFWHAALVRQLKKEPLLWYGGLKAMKNDRSTEESQEKVDDDDSPTKVLDHFRGTPSSELYRTVLNSEIRYKGPIFCMNQRLRLGQPYGLHFFEPRYRLLIAEVMQPFPDAARRGDPIEIAPDQRPPVFIHAHTYPLKQGSPAVLVQVIRCRIYPSDGRADVFLLPIAYVRMEFMWERPVSGHLYYGQCIRVGLEESQELDRASS